MLIEHLSRRRTLVALSLIAAVLTGSGCANESSMQTANAATPSPIPEFAAVSPEQWSRLAERTVFFGHQSVGTNIIDGIRDVLAENRSLRLRVVEASDPSTVSGPAIIHAAIGKNYDPGSKDTAFAAALTRVEGANPVAMYKYCFVDVDATTDPKRLFDAYAATIDKVRSQHPGLTVVHVTLPLFAAMPAHPAKALVKKLLGRGESPELEANVRRNQFNEMLVARYGGHDPIFDLARLESTRPNGSRAFYTLRGDTVYTLAEELTSDGGHLNEVGRKRAAQALLALLAAL